MRNFGLTKAERQAAWLSKFSDAVVTLDSKHAGKIEWPSALHFYYQQMDVKTAANTYVNNRKET